MSAVLGIGVGTSTTRSLLPMPPYISLLRVIAASATVRWTTWAATATVGRQSRTARSAVATCTSTRASCTRCTTTSIGRTGSPFAR